LLKAAKIDRTVGMIARIIREHPESEMLSHMPKFHEVFQPHDAAIDELTQKFHHDMKVRNKEKMNTVAYCEKVLKEAEKQAEVESIGLIDKFISFRKKQFKDKADAKDHFDYATFKKKIYAEIDQLEDNLMDVELKLQESLSGATADL
jgi:polyribonucleotide nucleotidyltransferase